MKKRQAAPIETQPFFDEKGVFQFRPVTSDARKAVRLPPLSPSLMDFFESFASNCSIECCGIFALVFPPPNEWDKNQWHYNHNVFKQLQAELTKAEELEANVVQIKELHIAIYKDDWLFFLRHLMENMEKSKPWH